jgi:hypothetical protein
VIRLRRITWREFDLPVINRDRYDLKCWLEARGARVSAWMRTWEIRW